MIDFGGIGLSEQTPGMRAHLAEWWRPDLAASFDPLPDSGNLAGLNHLPSTFDATIPPKLGVLRWPCGASRWAVFSALVSRKQWDDINALDPGSHTLTLNNGLGTEEITAQMWALPARPVCRIVEGQDLFLLTLVDERYWWWHHGAVDVAAGATWAAFFASLFASLDGATATVETVPAAYLTPTTRFTVGSKPIPVVLDAAATSVGAKIIRSRAGVNTVTRPGTALTASAALWESLGRKIVTGGTVEALTRSLPAEVDVTFYGATPAVETVSLTSLAITELVGDGETGRIGVVWPDIPSTATVPQRAAAGTQAAADWYRWQAGAYEGTFKGLVDWTPTGLEDLIEWGFADGKAFTTIHRWPVAVSNVYGDESTAGGGTLTVQNTDGTAIDSPTTTIKFDKTTGLQTSGTAGTSTVVALDTTLTQVGVVNIDTSAIQELGKGDKRVNGTLYVHPLTAFNAVTTFFTSPNRYFVLRTENASPTTAPITQTPTLQTIHYQGLVGTTLTGVSAISASCAFFTSDRVGLTYMVRPAASAAWLPDPYYLAPNANAVTTTYGTDDKRTLFEFSGNDDVPGVGGGGGTALSIVEYSSYVAGALTRWVGHTSNAVYAPFVTKGGLVIASSPPPTSPPPPAISPPVSPPPPTSPPPPPPTSPPVPPPITNPVAPGGTADLLGRLQASPPPPPPPVGIGRQIADTMTDVHFANVLGRFLRQSPNGTYWELKVDNSGNPSFAAISTTPGEA